RYLNQKLFPTSPTTNLTRESVSIKQFNLQLLQLSKTGSLKNIEEHINTRLVTPNLHTYSILMNYYNYANQHSKTREIWDFLITKSVPFVKLQPHYAILLDSIKFNSTYNELETIWQKFQSKPLSSNNYLSYLEGLIFFKQSQKAIQVYENEILKNKKCLPIPAMKQLIEVELRKLGRISDIKELSKKFEDCKSSWHKLNILRNNIKKY
ncbi:hypothetical protein CONCODRAFT_79911, partial [Conidiobolus coronatus NRRL 28638]